MNNSKQIVSNFVWKFAERIFARGIEFGIFDIPLCYSFKDANIIVL